MGRRRRIIVRGEGGMKAEVLMVEERLGTEGGGRGTYNMSVCHDLDAHQVFTLLL